MKQTQRKVLILTSLICALNCFGQSDVKDIKAIVAQINKSQLKQKTDSFICKDSEIESKTVFYKFYQVDTLKKLVYLMWTSQTGKVPVVLYTFYYNNSKLIKAESQNVLGEKLEGFFLNEKLISYSPNNDNNREVIQGFLNISNACLKKPITF